MLAAVAGIWGTIIIKLYFGLHAEAIQMPNVKQQNLVKAHGILESYTLHEYPRDPFLSVLTDTAAIQEVNIPKEKPVSKPTALPQYCGLIQGSKEKIAILKMNKKYFFLKNGEGNEYLKVLAIDEKQIVIKINAEKITVPVLAKQPPAIFH